MNKNWNTTLFVLAMVSLCATATVAAELVVIESRSGRYLAGKLVDDTKPIKLAEGESVTLLAQDGAMYKHEGPYEGSPVKAKKASDEGLMVTLKTLVHGKGDSEGSVGAVRSGGSDAAPTPGADAPAWSLFVGGAGEQCVAEGAPARFWRADAERAMQMTVKSLAGGASAELTWAAGVSELPWPEEVSLGDGVIYLIRVGDDVRSHHLVVHQIPAAAAGRPDAVAWLTAKGCRRQAEALLAELQAD